MAQDSHLQYVSVKDPKNSHGKISEAMYDHHHSRKSRISSTDDLPGLEPAQHYQVGHSETPGSKFRRDRLIHLARVLTAPAVVFGCSFALALQFALLTPFAIRLGVSVRAASIVWLMGPVTGLVVQPLIGHLSDVYHSRHATRMPIVYVATVLLLLSHIGIALAPFIETNPLAVVIASFWLFDACVNAIVVTTRAMLSDRFCSSDRTFAFAVLQFWTSMGYLLGYLTASSPSEGELGASVTRCFLISFCVVLGGTLLSVVSVHDKRACRMRYHTKHTAERFSFNTACLVSIVAGSALTWFGWFSQQIFQSEFVSTVFRIETPVESVRLSAFGLVIGSALSCITGLILIPLILSVTGTESTTLFRLWSLSSIFQGLDLAMSPFVRTPAGAILWEAATGPMYAVALSVPYMLIANGCDHGSTGRVMALVNVAVCFPQLVVSLAGSIVIAMSGGYHEVLFCVGGFLCFTAAYLLWVPVGEEVPPWSIKSARSTLVASTSDWLSPGPRMIPPEERLQIPFLPPIPSEESFQARLRGLSSPRVSDLPVIPSP